MPSSRNFLRIPSPPRLDLAFLPTPIRRLSRVSEKLGVDVWIKRDDLTGSLITGNKVRKLEFLVAEAKANGADVLVTCGGIQSNHARATAVIAARLGMQSYLILRGTKEDIPKGNLLIDHLMGAEVQFVTPEEYQNRDKIFQEVEDTLKKRGKTPYSIPEGGSNGTGAWGYVRAMEEIRFQEKTLGLRFDSIVHGVGSGGTSAGLIIGRRFFGVSARVIGVNVCDNREYFLKKIIEIGNDFSEKYRLSDAKITEEQIEILDGYVGRGYAMNTKEELQQIVALARLEAILLDPVYTGKAFIGLCASLQKDSHAFGRRILFLHTGGIFGVFAKNSEFASVV